MKRAISLSLLALTVLLLFACSRNNQNNTDPSVQGNNNSNNESDSSSVIQLLKENSSLPSLPGAFFDSVDTDGFDVSEKSGDFIYTNDVTGITYVFSGSTPETSTLTSVTLNKMGYALFGFTVGDKTSDAEMILKTSGFSISKNDENLTFYKNAVTVIIGSTNQTISYITITL